MALLAGKAYDPGTAVSKVVSSLQAMTAFDTTNLRLTFTAPANGSVLVRIRTCEQGTAATAGVLLGVLDGSTIRGRQAPIRSKVGADATSRKIMEASFVVTGLTPSTSYTWDAAYAVQVVAASSGIKYGGPNDTTSNNAHGAFVFEIWETTNLLAATLYDPAAAASKATSSLLAMTAFDTTNLRLTFSTNASGPGSTAVLVRMRTLWTGATGTNPQMLLGVLGNLAGGSGTNVLGRVPVGIPTQTSTAAASDVNILDGDFLVTGLTASTSYSFDAAYGVETLLAATNIRYGGPNDATGNDAWGGFAFEVWTA